MEGGEEPVSTPTMWEPRATVGDCDRRRHIKKITLFTMPRGAERLCYETDSGEERK